MSIPDDCRMTPTHEWHRAEGNTVTVGITRFAADELTDITFVDLPAVGTRVGPGEPFGEIESVKATSELFSAVSGVVSDINPVLADNPERVNDDPFGAGWMIKLTADDLAPLEDLLDKAGYEAMLAG